MYNELKCLASNMGFTVASKTNFEQKQISERKLKVVFCMTNGNPRYAVRYFKEGNFGFMVNALDDQYWRMLEDLGRHEEICRSFVVLLSTGRCQLWHPPSVTGGAY